MTKLIPLTRGLYALVDDEDFPLLSGSPWHASVTDGGLYAKTETFAGRSCQIRMHRAILGLEAGDGRMVDHINGDGLDNRRANLRLATPLENSANARPQRRGSTPYRGVWLNMGGGRTPGWCAVIRRDGKREYLGRFASPEQAALAYDARAIELFGEFARLNFPSVCRLIDRPQTMTSRGYPINNTSGYRGVTFHRGAGKWQANVAGRGRTRYIGLFETAEAAATAREAEMDRIEAAS